MFDMLTNEQNPAPTKCILHEALALDFQNDGKVVLTLSDGKSSVTLSRVQALAMTFAMQHHMDEFGKQRDQTQKESGT